MAFSRVMSPRTGKVSWRVRVIRHGQVVESQTFATERDAKLFDAARRTQVTRPDWVDPARGRVSVGHVAEEWLDARRGSAAPLTVDTDRGLWRRLVAPTFAACPVGHVTEAEVAAWLGDLAARDVAPATRRRALAVLRGVMAHAVADRRIVVSPAAAVKAPRGGTRREGQALTPDQVLRLLAELPKGCRPPVLFMALTGLRVSEMAGLQVGDAYRSPGEYLLRVHRSISQTPESGRAVLGDLKTHRARSVPVPRPLVEWVRLRAEAADPEAPLFAAPSGVPWTRGNFATRSGWSAARLRAGLPGVRIHDLRHTAATAMLSAGADVLSVSRVLGHSTPTLTLLLYGHVVDEGIVRAVAAADDRWADRALTASTDRGEGEAPEHTA